MPFLHRHLHACIGFVFLPNVSSWLTQAESEPLVFVFTPGVINTRPLTVEKKT